MVRNRVLMGVPLTKPPFCLLHAQRASLPVLCHPAQEVRRAVSLPVLVGSGVTHDNVDRYLGANGLIVGSHFKSGGSWSNALNVKCVNNFMTKVRHLRESE